MKPKLQILAITLLATAPAFGQGTILWDESVNGPFSFDYRSPTVLGTLSFGTNSILGATEIEPTGPGYFVHEDYFVFSIPSSSIVSAFYLGIDKPNVWTWIGDQTFSSELAFAGNPSSGSLLLQWSLASLSEGAYGMYMANHDAQPFTSIANYRLDFFVQAVPEPTTLSLLLVGVGLVGLRCWRNKRLQGAR